MTATSELGYYVRGVAQEIVGNRALDTAASRYIANNLNHLEDEETQAWGSIVGTAGGIAGLTYWELSSASTTEYVPFTLLPPIPVFLRARVADVTSTRFVVRVRCYMASAGTGTFLVALRTFDPTGLRSAAPGTSSPSLVATFTETSTTPVEHLVTVYKGSVSTADAQSFPSTDQDGNEALVAVPMGQIEVWGKTSGPLSRVEAFAAREFVG